MDRCSTDQHTESTPNKKSEKDGIHVQEQLMDIVYERLGSLVPPRELEVIGLENTPQYDPNEYVIQNKQTFSQLEEEHETTLEVEDQYV